MRLHRCAPGLSPNHGLAGKDTRSDVKIAFKNSQGLQ